MRMIGGEQHMKSETLAAKAVEKTLRGKVQKQTFPSRLEIPQKRGIPTFHTASTAAGHSFLSGLTGSDPNRRNWLPLSPALTKDEQHPQTNRRDGEEVHQSRCRAFATRRECGVPA